MKENTLVIYARMYRKGRKMELMEISSLLELHHIQQSLEATEKLKVLSGFDKWWHVNVRVGWKGLKAWIREWTLVRTGLMLGILVTLSNLWTFIETKNSHPGKEESTTSKVDTLYSSKQPLLSTEPLRKDSLTSADTSSINK